MNITQLIESYGYWALFALVAAESLGVPVPGETALIVAARLPWRVCTGVNASSYQRLSPRPSPSDTR